ncbi:MAG: AAA family ATPase [Propionibacteriaceae bacterium]
MLKTRKAGAAWLRGVQRLDQNAADAAPHFEQAVALDEAMADAWLGLHAAGQRCEQAVAAMAAYEGRFGEERKRHQRRLTSRFQIGPYVTFGLESHLDLWCAVAAGHIERGELDPAASALRRTADDALPATFLRGWLAFAQGDQAEAITRFRRVLGQDDFLEASARLMSGIALSETGVMGPAKQHLDWVLRQTSVPDAKAEAHQFLGLIGRAEGDEGTARHHLHEAYALNPSLVGLTEQLAMSESEARVELAREHAGPPAEEDQADEQQVVTDDPDSESVDQVLADLDGQIGQEGIKQQVRFLLAQTRAEIARREAGLPAGRMTEHFVFTGPPGTGKTTIARVVARLYKSLDILPGGHVVEVDRSGLIGEYHGHTVARTKEKVNEAKGGVLFVDEAYALQTEGFTGGDPFGQEAIDTLLKRMEDDRDAFVVIAAGYPEPMQRFLDSNPGLRSRFTTVIDFPSYGVDELVQIADVMAAATGNRLTDEARVEVEGIFTAIADRGELDSPTFGNARYVRNLIEKAGRQRDLRLFSDSDVAHDVATLTELTADDIRAAAVSLS